MRTCPVCKVASTYYTASFVPPLREVPPRDRLEALWPFASEENP